MRPNFHYHLLALLTIALWGTTFVSTKQLISAGLSPAQIYLIRFTVAYVGMWLICAVRRHLNREGFHPMPKPALKDELVFLLLGLSGGSLYFLAENTSLSLTQASNVSFIVTSAPLITVLLTIITRKIAPAGAFRDSLEDVRIRPLLVIGSICALAGMAIILFDGSELHLSVKGDLLALAAALTWAVYSIFMGHMVNKYGSMVSTRKTFFYGLVTIIPFVCGETIPTEAFGMPEVIANLAFLSVVASLLCFLLWNIVLTRIGNVTATNYIYLGPFFTIIAATLLLGEHLSPSAWLGSILIVAGVVMVCRKQKETNTL